MLGKTEQDQVKTDDEIEFLANSKLFDVHKWSDHPEVNSFVKRLYEENFEDRKRNITKTHVKVLLLDLYVNWIEDPARPIAISLNNNDYNAGTRYNELRISRKTISVVKVLAKAGLINFVGGFRNRETNKGRYTRIWPSDALVEMFQEVGFSYFDIGNRSDRLSVVLHDEVETESSSIKKQKTRSRKRKKQIDIEYDPTPETERMSFMLAQYNTLLSRTFIDIPILEKPWIEREGIKERSKLHIGQQNKFVQRIFNRGSFKCGGRFYGGWWWQCSEEWRSKIFINDKPTNEIDYSGLHTVMLYAEKGVSYWNVIGEDPYTIPTPAFALDERHGRAIAKQLLLILLNAKSSESAYQAFRSKAAQGSIEASLNNQQLMSIHEQLAIKHPLIADEFGADAGARLMNKDSYIAEHVLSEFTKKSIPALCVHDSFIVPIGYEDYLIDMMCEGFEKIMKVPLERAKGIEETSARKEDLEAALSTWVPYKNVIGQEEKINAYMNRVYPKKSNRYKKMWSLFNRWKEYV